MRTLMFVISLLVIGAGVEAREWRDIRNEADRNLPPRMQYYNKLKGKPKLLPWETDDPESLNVRLVGKWGRGPAASVTGRDTLVFLGLGSEVAIFNAANGSNPRIINEIQCRYVVDRVILKDNLLYAVLQGGIEVFDISDPQRAFRVKYLPLSVVDMCIRDTLAYTIDAESLKVYRIVSADSFQRLGACRDSGYYLTVDSDLAYLCDRWGLHVIDATNPASPRRASTLSGGAEIGAACVEGGYVYYTETYPDSAFVIASVLDPYNPVEAGRRRGIGGWDVHKLDYFVYLPGYQILDISQPTSPAVIGELRLGGWLNGVWTRSSFSSSFVAASYEGLVSLDISDPVQPRMDTTLAGAYSTRDVAVGNGLACVANLFSGMKVLDIADVTVPRQVGSYDSTGFNPEAEGVALRDSLSYLLAGVWSPTGFRVIDISDPRTPSLLATARVFNPGVAVVCRDTLAYVAEENRFEIFSIANPRAPRLVGSCGLPNSSFGLAVRDTLAYVANLTSLQVINAARPSAPTVVGACSIRALGVCLSDTIAYVAGAMNGFYAVSVANPSAPYVVGNLPIPGNCWDVAVSDTLAYVGADKMHVLSIANRANPVEVGYFTTPAAVRKLAWQDSLLYAACFDAGVVVLASCQSGIQEETPASTDLRAGYLTCTPNPSFGQALVTVSGIRDGQPLRFYDATGKMRACFKTRPVAGEGRTRVNISHLPSGVYFVTQEGRGLLEDNKRTKLVKQ